MRTGNRRRDRGMDNTTLYQINERGEEEGLIPLFLANREGENRTPATIHFYQQRLMFFYKWLKSNGRKGLLNDFSLDNVNEYVRYLQNKETKFENNPFTEPKPGKLSSVYIKNSVRAIKTFSVWLAEYDYTLEDVLAKRKCPKVEKKEIQVLRKDEIEKLLAVIDRRYYLGVRDLAIIWTFLDTGIRLSELRGLTMDGVDFKTSYLRVHGKGRKDRSVPFGATTKKWLMLYRDRWRPRGISDRFFLDKGGHPMSKNAVAQMVKKYGIRAGVPRVHPHLFRHTYATNYLRQHPGDLFRVQMNLGHETLEILQVYVHLARLEDQRDSREPSVMDRLEIRVKDRSWRQPVSAKYG